MEGRLMKDDELIEQMKAGVMPRIRDLMSQRHKEALDAPEYAQMCADAGIVPEPVELPLNQDDWEVVKSVWSSSLTTIAVHLLRAIAAMADEGVFVSNENSVFVAVSQIDIKHLVRGTGTRQDDTSFILQQMAETFKEVVRTHVSIMILINRKPVELRAE